MMNNKFSKTEQPLVSFDEKILNKPEYKKMLNNLLGIGARDNATFTSSKTSNFDLTKLISEADIKKVFEKNTFVVDITESKGDDAISQLSSALNATDFIDVADTYGITLSISDRKLLEKDFKEHSEAVITKVKKQKNLKISKWKKFRNKYLDIQAQTNSWPLYVGTMFIKVRTNSSTICAPLILKKVNIEITNTNRIQLKAMDEFVDVNEKLLFLLQNEFKFNIPAMNADSDGFSFQEVIDVYEEALSSVIDQDKSKYDFRGSYEFVNKLDVKNQALEFASGSLLMIVSPSGGDLRNKLIKMIKNGDIEDLFDFDVLRDLSGDVEKKLKNGEGIYRITPTDMSQERAIIGSLEDSAIIWGPPGTGKSQTIANILANLLYRDETVLVTSEKKAALDVIQQRMGKLSKFMFFGLAGKDVDKEQFYKPFRELARLVKISNVDIDSGEKPASYIQEGEFNYLKQATILKDENVSAVAYVYNALNEHHKVKSIVNGFYKNAIDIKDVIKTMDENTGIHDALRINNIQKAGIFKRYPKNIRQFVKFSSLINNDYTFMKNLIEIRDITNLSNVADYLKTEDDFTLTRSFFNNDEDFLEAVLAHRFRERLEYMLSSKKFGKDVGTFIKNCESGYRIPYKFISIYKDIINELFGIFVSTPQTLASTVDLNQRFDYAIFDEASQLHLEKAIPYIGMANKSIIAGDNQQMKPTNYFGVRDNSEAVDESDEDAESLLDYAYRKGLGGSREYMLTKNYRSVSSELMTFSSKHFYDAKLDVIDHCKDVTGEPIEVYNVAGKWEGRINEKEAHAVLQKLSEVRNDYEKIIILTLNANQKQYIDSLIYTDSNYADIMDLMGTGRVLLRNLENIQGDEADLVIVSVAYDKTASLGSTYVAKPDGKNALNVAISRAREKMIVFKSISSDEVKGSGTNDSMNVFKDWLAFLEMESSERKLYSVLGDSRSQHFDSEFEEEVYQYIKDNFKTSRKLYLETQYPVGSYKIDIALLDQNTGKFIYGIEVDGYKYHSGFEKMTKDIERQRFLESKKYPIFRVTELNWKISKEKVIESLKKLIKK